MTKVEQALLRRAGLLKPGVSEEEALAKLTAPKQQTPDLTKPQCRECGTRDPRVNSFGTYCGCCGLFYYPEEIDAKG